MASSSDQPRQQGYGRTLEDLPNEILLMVAKVCHLQPRISKWHTKSGIASGGLESWSCVNKKFRGLAIAFMFRRLRIRTGEEDVHTDLGALLANSSILQNTKVFVLTTQGQHTYKWGDTTGHSACDASAPPLLVNILKAMPQVQELQFNFEYGDGSIIPALRKLFRKSSIELPEVKSFNMNEGRLDFIVHACPNLERASASVKTSPKQSAGLVELKTVNSLTELEIYSPAKGFTKEHIGQIVEMFPNIQRLWIQGELGKVKGSSLAEDLAQLPQLKFLYLTIDPAIYVNPRLMDSAYMNARKEAKDSSPYLEEPTLAIASVFFIKNSSLRELIFNPGCQFLELRAIRKSSRTIVFSDKDPNDKDFRNRPTWACSIEIVSSGPRS